MRCAPIGIWAHDAKEAAAAAREDALLTHPHPICQTASAAFVAAIATGIGGGDREAMLAAAYAAVPEIAAGAVRERLDRAKRSERPEDFMHQQGWVLTAFQNAFRHLASGTSIEDALVETVGEVAIPIRTGPSAGRFWVLLREVQRFRCVGPWRCWLAGRWRRSERNSHGRRVIGRMMWRGWRKGW